MRNLQTNKGDLFDKLMVKDAIFYAGLKAEVSYLTNLIKEGKLNTEQVATVSDHIHYITEEQVEQMDSYLLDISNEYYNQVRNLELSMTVSPSQEFIDRVNTYLSELHTEPTHVTVIGTPYNTKAFNNPSYTFTFINGSEVSDYNFNQSEVWVLSYELTGKEKYMIKKANNLPETVNFFNQFGDVRPLLVG